MNDTFSSNVGSRCLTNQSAVSEQIINHVDVVGWIFKRELRRVDSQNHLFPKRKLERIVATNVHKFKHEKESTFRCSFVST